MSLQENHVAISKEKLALNEVLEFLQKMKTGGWRIPPDNDPVWVKIYKAGLLSYVAATAKDAQLKATIQREFQKQFDGIAG